MTHERRRRRRRGDQLSRIERLELVLSSLTNPPLPPFPPNTKHSDIPSIGLVSMQILLAYYESYRFGWGSVGGVGLRTRDKERGDGELELFGGGREGGRTNEEGEMGPI